MIGKRLGWKLEDLGQCGPDGTSLSRSVRNKQAVPSATLLASDDRLTYDDLAMALPYDPASQVTNILNQLTATSTQMNQAVYAYNPVGNRTSLTDRRGGQAFGYDQLDRVTSASHPLLATPQAFAYDAVGNRTTGGSVVNAGNQLTADANFAYQYDYNGNLTRKTLLATGNYSQYTYDAENRLTKVEDFVAGNPTPTATSTYRYDGLGRRIEKVTPTGTKRYVYDGEDILLEYDGANVLQARYTHGPGIDEPLAVTKSGSTFFYHQDGLGSVTDLTDSTGATAKSYSYDAYGTIVDQTGTVEQPYTYTGREFDSESGIYYYRARYYDASTGRLLQKDPIMFFGGINFYSYVGNNVPNRVDPSGLFSCGELSNCIERNKFSSLFDGTPLDGIASALEIVAPISLVSDIFAIEAKVARTGIGGSKQEYASGLNRVFRQIGRGTGSLALTGALVGIGDILTPALAVTGAFTTAYNGTIIAQCLAGILE